MKNKIFSIIYLLFVFIIFDPQKSEAQQTTRTNIPNLKTLYPDLIIKTVNVSDDKQKITVTAANICKGRSKPTIIRLNFRQKNGAGKGQIKFEVSGDVPALRENESSEQIVLDISNFASGQDLTKGNDIFFVELVIDPFNKVIELNETNNSRPIHTYSAPPSAPNHCDRRT